MIEAGCQLSTPKGVGLCLSPKAVHHRLIDCNPVASHGAMATMDAHTVNILRSSGFLCPNPPNAECQRANRSLNGVQLSAFRTSVLSVPQKPVWCNRGALWAPLK